MIIDEGKSLSEIRDKIKSISKTLYMHMCKLKYLAPLSPINIEHWIGTFATDAYNLFSLFNNIKEKDFNTLLLTSLDEGYKEFKQQVISKYKFFNINSISKQTIDNDMILEFQKLVSYYKTNKPETRDGYFDFAKKDFNLLESFYFNY